MKFVFILAILVMSCSFVELRKKKRVKIQKIVPIQTAGKKYTKTNKNVGKGDDTKTTTIQKVITNTGKKTVTTDSSKVNKPKNEKEATVQIIKSNKYSKKESVEQLEPMHDGGGRNDKINRNIKNIKKEQLQNKV